MTAWELTDDELAAFFAKMTGERALMSLTLEQLRSAEAIVAERDAGEVVAIAGVRRVRGLAVAFFVVLEPFQGRGLGKSLVRRLHSTLRERHYRFVCLSVQRDNTAAVHLYRSNGYRTFFAKGRTLYMFRLLRSKGDLNEQREPSTKGRLQFIVRLAIIAGALACFAWLVTRNAQGLDFRKIEWRWDFIAASFLFLQAGMLLNAAYLGYVFRFLGAPLGAASAYQTYFISALGRYIPGKVWQILAMTVLARRHGVGTVKSTSLFIINQMLIVLSGFVFVIVTGFLLSDMGSTVKATSLAPLAPLMLMLAAPNLLIRLLNAGLKGIHRPPIDFRLSHRYVLMTMLFVFCTFTLTGSGFVFLARGIGLKTDDCFFLAAVYPFAYLIGYLAFIVPGGIGVRESAIIFLLNSHYPRDQSALLALAALIWWTAVELANCTVALLTIKRSETKT